MPGAWLPRLSLVLAAAWPLAAASAADPPPPLLLEALTSPELRARIDAGTTTVLLPVGGVEQNGAHMTLGKHNRRVQVLAERIAATLGGALVAPVMPYVPEGRIEPPEAHMRWAGTVSVPEPAFEALLGGVARSLCHHGFRRVVLLGDHGGTQASLQRVAAGTRRSSCQVVAIDAYYRAAQGGFADWLAARGHAAAEIGTHAGLADTALMLAVAPSLVRADAQARGASPGVAGDPRRATAALGEAGVALIVERSVAAIRALPPVP